jgi:intracellular sulfur oxidation DsrE/DsrF family protein
MNSENTKNSVRSGHLAAKQAVFYVLLSFILLPTTDAAMNHYQPDKVVYDVSSGHVSDLNHILNRVGLLQKFYDNDPFEASIIIVLHENAIPFFAKSSKTYHSGLIQRIQSLTSGEIVQVRVCMTSAKMQGFGQKDFENFMTMVPMADAEIIQLQRQGFAYLR